jgi:AcrR family transcriptional regulator
LGVSTTGTDLLSVSDRDRILQAMAECCAEQGFAGTKVEDVLSRAGATRDSFESHFSGKEDCALAAFNKLVSETMLTVATAGAPQDWSAGRASEVKALLELAAARPSFGRLGLIDARQGGTRQMRQAYESASQVLALMMERGRPDDSLSRPSPRLARAALGGMEAVLRREISAGRAANLPFLLQDFIYAALVPFLGQREALRQARVVANWASKED